MSDIGFNVIPANLRLPGTFFEVSAVNANTNQQTQSALIIGQILGASAMTPNIPSVSAGAADAANQAGQGSMLALMTAAYCASDPFGEVWYAPLADAGGATAAAGSTTFAGTVTAAGVVSLYIAGQRTQTLVTVGMTAAQVATAVVATCAATLSLPVSAVVDGVTPAKVDFTALNKGLGGNDIDLRYNYLGSANGESMPAGLTATVTAMAGGAGNPSLSILLANLGDQAFDFIVSPYTDAASIAALTAFLSDVNGRWSWQYQLYGHVFMASRLSYGGAVTFGEALNDQHTTCLAFYDSPSPNWVIVADMAGTAAVSLRADPGVPLQGKVLSTALAPPLQSRFLPPLRNTLLFDGISTFTVNNNQMVIEDLITTYQKNAAGAPDNSYLQLNTMFQLISYLRQRQSMLSSTFANTKLVADGTQIPAGSNCVSPSTIRAALIAQYQTLSPGLVQAPSAYAAGLVVQINATNPSRVDILDDPILTGGLRIMALLVQFQNVAPAVSAAAAA